MESSEDSDLNDQYQRINDLVNKYNSSSNPVANIGKQILTYKKQELKVPKGFENLQSNELGELLQEGLKRLEFQEVRDLMEKHQIQDDLTLNQLLEGEQFNFQNQIKLFQNLLKHGYFTKSHQKKLELVKQLQVYKRQEFLKGQLEEIERQICLLNQTDQLMTTLFVSDDQSTSESREILQEQEFYESQLRGFEEFRGSQDSDRTLSYISEVETENPKSDFNKQRRRDIKELSKQFAKEAIKRHNKKQLQAFTFTTESRLPGRMRPSLNELVDEDFDISWVHTSERFKNFNRTKQILTIPSSTPEQTEDYKKQELERYKFPLNPWMYNLTDGRKAIVGPVFRKRAQIQNRPREHIFLKNERPPGVNILALVRDAAARLPDGVGTRTDVAELVKDSQFLAEGLTDYYISQTVSGGLDRLSAEEDPSVRFDPSSKLWVYLHGKRTLDSPKWGSDISESTRNNFQKNNEKFFIQNSYNKSCFNGAAGAGSSHHEGNSNDTTDIGTSSHGGNLSQDD